MAPGKKRVDVTWEHCKPLENDKRHVQCNYCMETFWGGVFRMKHHIAGTKKNVSACSKASKETIEMFWKLLHLNKTDKEDRDERRCDIGSSDSYYPDRDPSTDQGEKGKRKASMDGYVPVSEKKQCTLTESPKNGKRDTVCGAIARFFYANRIPFNVVKSSSFVSMMESVSHFGKELQLPSYDELEYEYLDNEFTKIGALMNIQKKEWEKRGCTIMFGGCTNGADRSVMNVLVSSFNGTYYLRSVDIRLGSPSAEELFEVFDSVVEEVGEEHVVQFMTDSASANVKAGELLMQKRKKLFWSPCAAHLLVLMLDDIGKLDVHADTIAKAGIISQYIYKEELSTRLSTSYHHLVRLILNRAVISLTMIASENLDIKEETLKVHDIIQSSSFWSSIDYIIKCASPLVKVRHLLHSHGKSTMPYVYAMMDRAKKAIAKNVDNVEEFYRPIWNIVDQRWNLHLRCPLSAAKCYLNPAFHYEESFNTDTEMKKGLDDLLKRLCPTSEEIVVIDQQLDTFTYAMSLGREKAKGMRKTKRPDLWWESNGGWCPELQMLAIRVLSQTCIIASGYEHSWSTFQKIRSFRSHRFDRSFQDKLVYVIHNINLLEQQEMREANRDMGPICLSDSESDDERITLPEDPGWLSMAEEDNEDFLDKIFINL